MRRHDPWNYRKRFKCFSIDVMPLCRIQLQFLSRNSLSQVFEMMDGLLIMYNILTQLSAMQVSRRANLTASSNSLISARTRSIRAEHLKRYVSTMSAFFISRGVQLTESAKLLLRRSIWSSSVLSSEMTASTKLSSSSESLFS